MTPSRHIRASLAVLMALALSWAPAGASAQTANPAQSEAWSQVKAEAAAKIASETETWKKVIASAGIHFD